MKIAKSKKGRRAGIDPVMVPAIYVGHHGRSGALIALTEFGAAKARSFRKSPESERYDIDYMKKVKGVPWDLSGKDEKELSIVAGPFAAGIPIVPAMSQDTPPKPIEKLRKLYVAQIGRAHV